MFKVEKLLPIILSIGIVFCLAVYLAKWFEIAELPWFIGTMPKGVDAMVAIKARMAPTGSENGLIGAVNRVESAFRVQFPMTAWLFFEPDLED